MQLQALLHYAGRYDGALGYNNTNMSATLSAVRNAGLGYSLEQMSNLNGPWLDDALRQMKGRVESSPKILKAILKDAETHQRSGKEGVDIKSGRALQALGYDIAKRPDYDTAISDLKARIEPAVKSAVDLVDVPGNVNPQASLAPINLSCVNKFNRASGGAPFDCTREFNVNSGAAWMKKREPAPEAKPATVKVSYEPASPKQVVPEDPAVQPQSEQSYVGVDWNRIPSVPVTEDMKHALRCVAGVSDNAARTGVLNINDEGHIILIRKIGEGDTAQIVAHDVTNEIDNISGLGEVPLSQRDFKMAADAFREAKDMDKFDPRAGIKVHCIAEIDGWGALNDKKYDLWVHQSAEGRIQVSLLTNDQKNINSDMLGRAEIQTSELEQFRATQEFDIEKPAVSLKI